MSWPGRPLVRFVQRGSDWTKYISPNPVLKLAPAKSIDRLLESPTWSVRSLLPPGNLRKEQTPSPAETSIGAEEASTVDAPSGSAAAPDTLEDEITPQKLHHLLRLSALPLPRSAEEESRLLHDLRSQVHFVKHLQSVDTSDVEPLVAIRDETEAAKQERQVTLADLQPWLDNEAKVGRNGTVRRRKTDLRAAAEAEQKRMREEEAGKASDDGGAERFLWEDLKPSGEEEGRRWGKYYVVRRGKKMNAENGNAVG